MEGKPFAIIGVNGDNQFQQVKEATSKGRIPWPSIRNERAGRASVSDEWNLLRWPTTYLIDSKGVIREKWIGASPDKFLDPAIDRLVEEAEAGKK
jgi:hypothetical protein